MTPRIGLMPMFLGEAAAPARPVAGVMADAPIGVCSPFPMGTTAVDADPALSCRDFAALGFRALEALDGAESVGSAAFGRSFAVALVACLSAVCSLAASMRSASVARVLISEVLARKAVFLAAWRVSEKCPFRQSAPDGGGGASPTSGAVGRRHKGGGWGSPTEGADFFARWVRQACGSAPLGGWGLSGAIWVLQRNPEANPEASFLTSKK